VKGLIKIEYKKKLLGFIIKSSFKKEGIEFLTPYVFSQQLAFMRRPKGYVITPHKHLLLLRKIRDTQETLFIRKGKVRIDFYWNNRHYLESRIVQKGDVVFLASGGHGFECIKDSEIIEVKQGPFSIKTQPKRLKCIAKNKLRMK